MHELEALVVYRIAYSPDAEQHMRGLTARQRALVFDRVDQQLGHEATIEARNRRRTRSNPVAPWELRIGNLRVYYDIEQEPEPAVLVRAVGLKERNVVRIGKEVIQL